MPNSRFKNETEELNYARQSLREKGIKVMGLILFITAALVSVVYTTVNDSENPYGNLSESALNTVVCHGSGYTLKKVLSTSVSDYTVNLRAVHEDLSDPNGRVLSLVTIDGMLKMESGSHEKALIKLDITPSLVLENDMVVSSAVVGGRNYGTSLNSGSGDRRTDAGKSGSEAKSSLSEVKDLLCGDRNRRSYI